MASRQLGLEGVEAAVPEPPVPLQPAVDVFQRFGTDGVQASGPGRTDIGESALPKDPEMAGDGRLGESELGLRHSRQVPSRRLTVGEQLEQPAPYGIAENIECMHSGNL